MNGLTPVLLEFGPPGALGVEDAASEWKIVDLPACPRPEVQGFTMPQRWSMIVRPSIAHVSRPNDTAASRAISFSSMSHLTHSRTDGNTAEVGRSRLDMFDAVPLRLIPHL